MEEGGAGRWGDGKIGRRADRTRLERGGDAFRLASYTPPPSALALEGRREHSYNALCRLLNLYAMGERFSHPYRLI